MYCIDWSSRKVFKQGRTGPIEALKRNLTQRSNLKRLGRSGATIFLLQRKKVVACRNSGRIGQGLTSGIFRTGKLDYSFTKDGRNGSPKANSYKGRQISRVSRKGDEWSCEVKAQGVMNTSNYQNQFDLSWSSYIPKGLSGSWHQVYAEAVEKMHLSFLNLPRCDGLKSFLTIPGMRAACAFPSLP